MKKWEEANNLKKLRKYKSDELKELTDSLRDEINEFTNNHGGHHGSQLGAVEINVALLRNFDFTKDKVTFDINNQADSYKLLTGQTLTPESHLLEVHENPTYNHWTAGHTSTALAGGLGYAKARDLKKEKHEVISVVGDASFWSGLNMEAFLNAPALNTKMIVILNDNDMSIEEVDGLGSRLSRHLGIKGSSNINKTFAGKDSQFEFIGPIDGNNIEELEKSFQYAKSIKEKKLVFIWAKTIKGLDKNGKVHEYTHWVLPGHKNGNLLDPRNSKLPDKEPENINAYITWYLGKMIPKRKDFIMYNPSTMLSFPNFYALHTSYPERVLNINIMEEFGATFGAGLALSGIKPIYYVSSTFSQRAFDQFVHDVTRMKQPMFLILEGTGLDVTFSESHQAMFDSAMFKGMPNTEIYEPLNTNDARQIVDYYMNEVTDKLIILRLKSQQKGDIKNEFSFDEWSNIIDVKKPEANIISYGAMAEKMKNIIEVNNLNWNLINATSIKPLDEKMIKKLSKSNLPLFTVEQEYRLNSLGAQINDYYNLNDIDKIVKLIVMDNNDFNRKRTREEVDKFAGLDNKSIIERIKKYL